MNPPSKTACTCSAASANGGGGGSYGRGLWRPEMQGNGCIPLESRMSGRNSAAVAVAVGAHRCGRRRPSTARNGGGGWGQHARSRNRPGDSRNSRDLQRRPAAQREFHSSGAERVGRVLECTSRQRLARVGGRARFALSTPTSAGRGRADGGAPKIICGSGTDGRSVPRNFSPQTANRRLFCGLGRFGGAFGGLNRLAFDGFNFPIHHNKPS
jgi:hypothetical protein